MKDIHVVFAANPAREQLSALAAHLLEHRDAILDAWRAYGDVLPGRNIAASLSRAQFNDHIPAVLDSLSQSLQSWPAETTTIAAQLEADKVADHGVQRWQQGYSLAEVLREWGYLQMCVAGEGRSRFDVPCDSAVQVRREVVAENGLMVRRCYEQ